MCPVTIAHILLNTKYIPKTPTLHTVPSRVISHYPTLLTFSLPLPAVYISSLPPNRVTMNAHKIFFRSGGIFTRSQ